MVVWLVDNLDPGLADLMVDWMVAHSVELQVTEKAKRMADLKEIWKVDMKVAVRG